MEPITALYDKREVARTLHCSVSKVEKMMRAGEITYKKIGTLVRFRPSDLAPFFEGTPASPGPIPARTAKSQPVENTGQYDAVRGRD